jgi:hypothetical protein
MITPIGREDRRHAFVRQTVIRSVVIVTTTAIGALIALAPFGDHEDLVIRAAFAIGGVLVALTLLNGFASYLYGGREGTLERRPQRGAESWPTDLLDIEGRVTLSKVSAFDSQMRLRPLLREIAARRLEANRHLDIEKQAARAREALGAELWDEVQPVVPSRDQRDLPGPTTAAIVRLVDKLESI